MENKFTKSHIIPILIPLLSANLILAHTTSVGYENSGPGSVTFWYGTYHGGTNFTEGQLRLEGVNGTSFNPVVVSFTNTTLTKPTGLEDGTTNFYTNGTTLVATNPGYIPAVVAWQGVTFDNLSAGTYRFTYVPIAQPTATWDPWDQIILSSVVTLSSQVIYGNNPPPSSAFEPVSNVISKEGARILDWLIAHGSSDVTAILNSVSSLSASDRAKILNKLLPNTNMAINQTSLQTVGSGLDSVQARLNNLRNNYSVNNLNIFTGLSSGDNILKILDNNIWVKAFGGHTNQHKVSEFSGFHSGTYGFSAGYDSKIETELPYLDTFILGSAFTYAYTDIDMKDERSADTADVDTYQFTIYATKEYKSWYIESMIALAYQQYTSNRNTNIAGIAKADFDGAQFAFRAIAGMPVKLQQKLKVTPLAGVEYGYTYQNEYKEKGAGALSMTINSDDVQRVRSILGTELATDYPIIKDIISNYSLHLNYRHDFKTNGAAATANFVGGGSSFVTSGQKISPDSINIGLGAVVNKGTNLTLSMQVDSEFANHYSSYSGQIVGKYNF